MYNEMGLLVDQDEVMKAIEDCDVFLVGFRNTNERLIVDTRHTDSVGPLVEVTESTGSIEGRMFWLGQRRPEFGMPEAFKFFVWPNSIDWLEQSGTWNRVKSRLVSSGYDAEVDRQMGLALPQLQALEHQTHLDAIRGTGYMTMWSRQEDTAG